MRRLFKDAKQPGLGMVFLYFKNSRQDFLLRDALVDKNDKIMIARYALAAECETFDGQFKLIPLFQRWSFMGVLHDPPLIQNAPGADVPLIPGIFVKLGKRHSFTDRGVKKNARSYINADM